MNLDDPLYGVSVLTAIGSQGVDEEDISLATNLVAESESSMVAPELLYGREEWNRRLAKDPGNNHAEAEFDFDWNFGLTPRGRAEAVWRSGFRDAGYSLLRTTDEETHAVTKSVDAAHLERIRNRRARIGGI